VRAAVLLCLIACGDNVPASISIGVPSQWETTIQELITLTPYTISLGDDGAFPIALVEDASMAAESYRISVTGNAITVRAGDALGAQYGTAHALEALGFRFRHPFDTYVPTAPELDDASLDGALHQPETRVRGYQLHTLHPIEGYYAFWEPSPGSKNDAHRIIDWVVKNRGNFLQWVALDDILDPARGDTWRTFTRELIDYAHARGVRTGLNIQLFGQSNLQLAFDLVDSATVPIRDQIAARLPVITNELPFDVYDLSFGEFFNADPVQFISSVNEVKNQLAVRAPQAEMHAVVHVGAEQIVNYMGEDLLYYFLVKYTDPAIVPEVHTTMFYNLFETASGAYQHTDFHEHRQFLYEQACAGRRPAYFPETAYWVAFDNSVPQFLPLYVHNRWLDLAKLREPGVGIPCPNTPLDAHLLFSSGWEWGYWLHDVTALRASYELPATADQLVVDAFGHDLESVSKPVLDLIALQRHWLHANNLAAYFAGRDVAIDAGRQLDIISQPDRITFADIIADAFDPPFLDNVMLGLEQYSDELDAIAEAFYAIDVPAHSKRWSDELRDGFQIDQLRVRFVIATYQAVFAQRKGDSAAARGRADLAAEILDDARVVVKRRHANLHDTHRRRLVDKASDANPNRTFYQYGYLYNADILCFWQRELTQVEGILGLTSANAPGCLLP
jgi:hypothetical protein